MSEHQGGGVARRDFLKWTAGAATGVAAGLMASAGLGAAPDPAAILNRNEEEGGSHTDMDDKRLGDETMEITTRQHVRMLSEEVAEQLKYYHLHWRFVDARCLMKNDDHGPRGIHPPIIPHAPLERARVFTGTRDTGSFNHHSQIARFRGRYYLG